MTPPTMSRTDGRTYLFDMISEMAKIARRVGEIPIAIHLEAILAAARAARDEERVI